jgi:hypothetical protein
MVVLDDSYSMRARAEKDGTSRDRARAALETEIRRRSFRPVRFVLAGTAPRSLGTSVETAAEALAALDEWECYAPAAQLDRAVGAAREQGGKSALVLVVTDGAPPSADVGERLRWLAFGRPLPNAAFVFGARSPWSEAPRCMLEIANFSGGPLETTLELNGEKRAVRLRAEGRKRFRFELPDRESACSAVLEEDALAEDNRINLLPSPERKVGAAVRMGDERLKGIIEKAVAASGLARLPSARPHILFTDMPAAQPPHGNCWIVECLSEADAKAYRGPFVADYSHPLMKGLSLEGIIWGAGSREVDGGAPVISIGDTAVLSEFEEPSGGRRIVLRLRPDLSTIQRTPAWPGLIWNLLDWRADHFAGMRRSNVRAGREVPFRVEDGIRSIRLTGPDGGSRLIPVMEGRAVLTPDRPGIYRVALDSREISFAANFFAPEESDLSGCVSGEWGSWDAPEITRKDFIPLGWLFLLLALAGLLIHLVLAVSRRPEGERA